MAKKKAIKFTKNSEFISVKKCCASCVFKGYTNDLAMRRCKLHHADVEPQDVCRQWQMNDQMKRAGTRGDGRVKRKEYLMFLMSVREAEWLAEVQGQKVQEMSIEEIRAEFEQKHGSIYFED